MYNTAKIAASHIFSKHNLPKMQAAGSLEVLTTTINVGAPFAIADAINKIVTGNNSGIYTKNPQALLICAGLVLMMAQTLPKFRNIFIDAVRANVQKELTNAMVKKSFDNELDQQVNARTGEFAQALSKNYSSVDKGIPSFFNEIIPLMLEVLSASIVLTVRFGGLGIIPFVVFVFYSMVALYGESHAEKIRKECVEESYKGYGKVIEAIGNYQLAHQFGNVDYELGKTDEALVKSETKFREMHHTDDWNALKLSIVNAVGLVGGIALFFFFPPEGTFKAVNFGLYAYFMTRLNTRLDTFSNAISSFHTALIDGEKISKYLKKTSTIQDISNPITLDTTEPLSIEFDKVSFSYQNKVTLTNISFQVNSGKKLAVVGPTGAGKSTIMKLLMRFYAPDSGVIRVNGIDISQYSAQSLRKHFAVVSQEAGIFSDTIKNNVKYGDLTANDEDIENALSCAELLRQGEEPGAILNRNAGQQGSALSGGEKQRIAIARAVLKGGAACILDEPTSALDAKTEADVQKMLDNITYNTTTLLVTHRLGTTVNADNILYIDQGVIMESGSFSELIAKRGRFFEQLEAQCKELGINVEDIRPVTRVQASQRIIMHDRHSQHADTEQSKKSRINFDFMSRRKGDSTHVPDTLKTSLLSPVAEKSDYGAVSTTKSRWW